MHARYGHISTSGLKSDVTIVFLGPDFLQDAEMNKYRITNICMDFQNLLAKNWDFGGQNGGRDGAMLTPNKLVFTFMGSYVCTNLGENRSRNATVRMRQDGYTDTLTDANQFLANVNQSS